MNPLWLKLLPYKWIGVGLVALALIGVIGVDKVTLAGLRVTVANGERALSDYRREAAVAARAAEGAARSEERRIAATIQEKLDERDHQLVRARADRVIADAATGRLQLRYAAALADSRATRTDPGTAGGSAAAPPGDLPADLFGGLLVVARQYRDAAEDAITAGELAERAYDALMPATLNLPPMKLSAQP